MNKCLEAGARAINKVIEQHITDWTTPLDEVARIAARAAAIAMVGALTHEAIDRIEDATVGATYVEGFRAELVKQLTEER